MECWPIETTKSYGILTHNSAEPFPSFFLYNLEMFMHSNGSKVYSPENQHDHEISTMNEDVFPIEYGDFPASHLSFQGFPLATNTFPHHKIRMVSTHNLEIHNFPFYIKPPPKKNIGFLRWKKMDILPNSCFQPGTTALTGFGDATAGGCTAHEEEYFLGDEDGQWGWRWGA